MLALDKPWGIDSPFRVAVYDDCIRPATYAELLETMPGPEFMQSLYAVGNKLSFNNRADGFDRFLAARPGWQSFYNWIRGAFPELCQYALGVKTTKKSTVRFEFSHLPGDGGGLEPHPDTAKKVATAVLYMEPDWDANWGGSFLALRHKERPDDDFTNERPKWDEVETILTVPVAPRRIVFMQRTNNSLHGVRPLTSPRPRRSVTINLIG